MLELSKQDFNCSTSYLVEIISSIDVEKLKPFFNDLPLDPYIKDKYRFRRLSHFKISEENIVKLPHRGLFQSKEYNPLLGDVMREFAELDDDLIKLEDFQRMVLEFFEFCKLCSPHDEVAVHQIRTTASRGKTGKPAPEGIHRDGVDLIGIFSVNRERIEGAETHLYKSKKERPIFRKVLNPGEILVFSDREFFHFTSTISAISEQEGVRDVFVLTCPGLSPKR
ncbi:MAG: 2OG-Fe dioxygenase family protein [Scytonema sp. PMC 1069.18]|nr:2OG-Fe dioxygenase family protein [Scytonema sp. PMC 1069.18]MEC4882202.1 2OG-Fe dioxygenase family protein [Scytonema sp. PMC 1070.18]